LEERPREAPPAFQHIIHRGFTTEVGPIEIRVRQLDRELAGSLAGNLVHRGGMTGLPETSWKLGRGMDAFANSQCLFALLVECRIPPFVVDRIDASLSKVDQQRG
jgi:hypothetical protein